MYKHICPPKERLSKQALALRTTVFLILAALIILLQPSFVLAQASPEATVYTDRAVLAYDANRYNEALKELKEALRLNPKSVDALYYHGLVLLALKRPSEALASLEKALKLRPGDVDVTFQLGVCISIRGIMKRQSRCYNRCIEPRPSGRTSAITSASWSIGIRTIGRP